MFVAQVFAICLKDMEKCVVFFLVANAKKSKVFRMKLCFVQNLIY